MSSHLTQRERNPIAGVMTNKSRASKRVTFLMSGPSSASSGVHNRASFNWSIPSFRRLIDTKTEFNICSPIFTCPLRPRQLSEWYLSLTYYPKNSGSLKIGVFLKSMKGDGVEVRAKVALSILQSRGGGEGLYCGYVKRKFRVGDPSTIFNRTRDNSKEQHCCGGNSKIEHHQWFNAIPYNKIIGIQDRILADNVLRFRAKVKILQDDESDSSDEEVSETPRPDISVPGQLPAPVRYWDKLPGADIVLMCDKQDFKVHKNIISAASPVFKAMIENFKDTTGEKCDEESHLGECINTKALMIPDMEPSIMEILLEGIYSRSLGSFTRVFMTTDMAEKILRAAHDYKLLSVKTLCFQKMKNELNTDNIGIYATLAQDYKAPADVKFLINKLLRRNWTDLQKNLEFCELFREKPEAFEFVFSGGNVH